METAFYRRGRRGHGGIAKTLCALCVLCGKNVLKSWDEYCFRVRLLGVGVLVVPSLLVAQSPSVASGTYTLLVCRPQCAAPGSDTLARGRIAFFSYELDSLRLHRILAEVPRMRDILRLSWQSQRPNACYVYDAKEERARSNATVHFGALGNWDVRSGEGSISLYSSPDAWHSARVVFRDAAFAGSGRSTGADVQTSEIDFLEGRLIGPADSTVCVDAARAELRMLEDVRRRSALAQADRTLAGSFLLREINGKGGPGEFPPGSGTMIWNGFLQLDDSTSAGRRFRIGFTFVPKADSARSQSHGGTFRVVSDSLLFTNDGQETRPPVRFRYAWRPDGVLALTDAQGNVWGYRRRPD
jgi:hypothetical protein